MWREFFEDVFGGSWWQVLVFCVCALLISEGTIRLFGLGWNILTCFAFGWFWAYIKRIVI